MQKIVFGSFFVGFASSLYISYPVGFQKGRLKEINGPIKYKQS